MHKTANGSAGGPSCALAAVHSANLFPLVNGRNYYDIVKDKSRSSHGTHFRPYSMKKADDIVSPAHLLLRKQENSSQNTAGTCKNIRPILRCALDQQVNISAPTMKR